MTLPVVVSTTGHEAVAEDHGLLTSRQVCELTGITYRILDYWSRQGLITPKVAASGSGTVRLWSPEIVDVIDDLVRRIQSCPYPHGPRGALT